MAAASRNYARAFAEVIVAKKLDPEAALAQLETLAQAAETSPELRQVWESPSIPLQNKLTLLDALAERAGAHRMVRNLVAVIVEKGRVHNLPEVARHVRQELNARFGVSDAEVFSTRPLDEQEKRALEQQMAQLTGSRIRARYEQDSSLLGGVKVKIGSTVYDGSVRGQLQRLRRQIASA